ncbi:MAG: cyclase, partial [Nitrospiraceae bacterium]
MMIESRISRTIALLYATFLCLALVACARERTHTLVDLTYPLGEETVYWPTNKPFQWEKTYWGMTEAGYWYASANFSASEHGGTHIDAPIHFAQGRLTVDQIPIDRLIGPAVVIDVRRQCEATPDYELTVQDLLAWESRHGRIPDGAVVFMW